MVGAHVGVPNEGYILYFLEPHNAYECRGLLNAPENDTLIDFVLESLPGHIWLCPAIRRDHPFISLRSVVNDAQYLFKIPVIATTDHEYLFSLRLFSLNLACLTITKEISHLARRYLMRVGR